MPATFKVCPCSFLTVIENTTFNGICRRLKLSGKLLGMIGKRGIRKLPSLASPVKNVAFTICLPSSVIRNRVPLHNLGTSKLRINKTGAPFFNIPTYVRTPQITLKSLGTPRDSS
ncbi:hypothetical protein TNCV_3443111 [Trichonephila clavipes]|nr:hypothetical protein TNCV_3443111 [Trichonephila clavipes]